MIEEALAPSPPLMAPLEEFIEEVNIVSVQPYDIQSAF